MNNANKYLIISYIISLNDVLTKALLKIENDYGLNGEFSGTCSLISWLLDELKTKINC